MIENKIKIEIRKRKEKLLTSTPHIVLSLTKSTATGKNPSVSSPSISNSSVPVVTPLSTEHSGIDQSNAPDSGLIEYSPTDGYSDKVGVTPGGKGTEMNKLWRAKDVFSNSNSKLTVQDPPSVEGQQLTTSEGVNR